MSQKHVTHESTQSTFSWTSLWLLPVSQQVKGQPFQESSCIQWKGKANMMHSISDKSNLIETSDKVLSVEFQKSKDSKSSYDNGNGGSNGVEKNIKRDVNDRVDTSAESSNIEDEDKEVEMENSSHVSSSSSLNHSALEEQADLALANRRLKDASDIYLSLIHI